MSDLLPLHRPVLPETFNAVLAIHANIDGFGVEDTALKLLDGLDWDEPHILVRVSVLNALYGTNLLAVTDMAKQIIRLVPDRTTVKRDISIVEDIAPLAKSKKVHTSFAAKFSHFFLDKSEERDAFPIYDSVAVAMLKYHLRRGKYREPRQHRYVRFVEVFNAVRSTITPVPSVRDFDKYLWLGGLYREWWKRRDKAKINTRAKDTFKNPTPKVVPYLDTLDRTLGAI